MPRRLSGDYSGDEYMKSIQDKSERVMQGGSNFGGHSAKGIKHGARGRDLKDTSHGKFMKKKHNYDDGLGAA